MAYPRSFIEEIKNRVSVSDIVGQKVKLTKRGREFVGLSPFKNERTPSFTVNDEKQFYHCFSTGKHGTVFDFLMETEGLGFPEAVERLAARAGIQVPAQDPRMVEKEEKNASLIDICEMASVYFKTRLGGAAGRGAFDYLIKRGLEDTLIQSFGLGYAPGDRVGLVKHLRDQGVSDKDIIEAGLALQPEGRSDLIDRFRNRVIFPITDSRDRVIAFGGRALEASVPAKYLNSPETPLFHKGRTLYNFAKARQSAFDTKTLLVVEGYMDVIGLARGGFNNAVASLGTAVTEEQISLLWRLVQEPVLCLDGDEAGLRAAYRVIDRALPLLKPGYSLRFAVLPQGKDPDDLVREGGAEAFNNVLERANSLIDMLWERELAYAPYDTPERRAAFSDRLRKAVRQIEHIDVRKFYGEEIKKRLDALFAPANRGPQANGGQSYGSNYGGGYSRQRGGGKYYKFKSGASAEARRSALASGAVMLPPREAMIMLAFIRHSSQLSGHLSQLEKLDFVTDDLKNLRDAIVDAISHNAPLDSGGLKGHLISIGYENLMTRLEQLPDARMLIFVRPESDPEDVVSGWLDAVELQHRLITLTAEKREAETDLAADTTQENFERLMAIENEISTLESKTLN
ncbi:MAG: DNA primase [Candidatus Micropelagos sp.]|uniref:DNA primase n=1 Tax=PS1 clade bacterium TaxID=2175152 RepID=A0A368EIR5_9PROT|nr:MAG: DNA primase [PS1 clade bacterium]